MNEYHIDQQGIDGRWRVWWLDDRSYTRERLFDSREQAEAWVEQARVFDATF